MGRMRNIFFIPEIYLYNLSKHFYTIESIMNLKDIV